MAGGVGSRFWPLSTPEYPKQFIDILGCGRTLIQLTVDRFKGVCPMSNFWVVTNAKYVDIMKQQYIQFVVFTSFNSQFISVSRECIGYFIICWFRAEGILNIFIIRFKKALIFDFPLL